MTLTHQAAEAQDHPTPRLSVTRDFSTEGIHPYDQIEWTRRNVEQTNYKTGETVFEQRDVEFPASWSDVAATIVTTKYFRGALGTEQRETSLRQVIDRVVAQYQSAAHIYGYMSEADAQVFGEDLTWLLVNQYFSFNSPVWFNVGTSSPQQVSACFILAVDDSMESILNWYKEEGFIFKGGSGAGLNISRIRSSKELLASSGGNASGPVSFMRGADASAGTIKSGGATRRAAKMVVLDVDHPDIEEFVETKAREEDKIRALRDAGFDMDLGGKDIVSVQYQNANNSVRVSDAFMRAVEDGTEFGLTSRTTGEVIETIDARTLWRKIATAAWECADPGIQYDDTINDWHTLVNTGRITASNPCSEYMSIDNSSCNLASLNLMKFLGDDDVFDTATFVKAVRTVITAMEISISFADFPTPDIDRNTRDFRQLGIGYANLGAMLMAMGLGYDTPEGRAMAAAITSVMTGASYRRSAEIAAAVGPYKGYAENEEPHKRVMVKHLDAANALVAATRGDGAEFVADLVVTASAPAAAIAEVGQQEWDLNLEIGAKHGWRNSQASVLAPTGTIGFMMDCDTTGIEPDFSLVKFKKMVGGGFLNIVNNTVPRALTKLGYSDAQIADITEHIEAHSNVVDAPHLDEQHYAVFDCAAGAPRALGPMGHVRMMAACQPFLSGAISKTVNLPESATVEEIADIYMDSWRLGLKATAVYRDNAKVGQPLSNTKTASDAAEQTEAPEAEVKVIEKIVEKVVEVQVPRRTKMPRTRNSQTTSFKVGEAEGYMTAGRYADDALGEIFMKFGKQGSTMAGVMDAFSMAVSIGLQYGVPLETYVAKMTNLRFEPSGLTDDPDIRMSASIMDYVFRRLALDHLPFEIRDAYKIYSAAERTYALDNGGVYTEIPAVAQDEVVPADTEREQITAVEPAAPAPVATPKAVDKDLAAQRAAAAHDLGHLCSSCGHPTQPAGACRICPECGTSSGCS
ncbi:vitamin B12-dependent ribonucleotide reductase [Nocardioides sp. Leaf285]|uniref:vitamin B12-dependent ribonucleotide reductase n=1 Tax=Nocardioides sp. Leaf285 TaxID=1736322 RepID=UPI0007037E0D|nr:vitamin B12-dependent ribonucleotide reductase [Nocardioides sp. Leaf285]KQP63125.1 vitamin B12-dependent ribonucleotide reductase [Nocardioides sp. Leaf285]